MKYLYIIIGLFCLYSCNDDIELEQIASSNDSMTSRSAQVSSGMYDWEGNSRIPLGNSGQEVILPWYSGASITAPNYIIQDYQEADGWKLLYNTCTTSELMENGRYYLLFYNIFSGKLRGFVYNGNDVTGAQTTFWQLYFSQKTPLLNDSESVTLPLDQLSDNTCILTTNITNNAAKALGYGWNCFEYDLLMYDPNLSQTNLTMSLNAYDVNESNLDIDGTLELSSEGTIITTVSQSVANKLLNQSNSMKLNIGDNVTNFYDNFKISKFSADSKTVEPYGLGSIFKVGDIISKGYNFLVKKFGSKNAENVEIAKSDVKIATEGNIKLQGTLKNVQNSNVYPISNLLVPGATPGPNNITLPSYNNPIGVWGISTTPTIGQAKKAVKKFHLVSGGGSRYSGYEYWDIPYGPDPDSYTIYFNPSLLPYIDRYTISVDLVGKTDVIADPSVTAPTNGFFGATIYQEGNNRIMKGSTNATGLKFSVPYLYYRYVESTLKTVSVSELGSYNGPYECNYSFPHNDIELELKVTVTIYPKAPYNTTPFVSTRTIPYKKAK